MRKIYTFLSLLIVLAVCLQAVSAEKTGQALDVKITCLINNAYCSASTTCNLTLLDANNNVIVSGVKMTYQSTYFNYTLKPSQTLLQGSISGNAVCTDGTVTTEPAEISFNMTPSGLGDTLGYSILIYAIVYVIGFVGFFGKNEWVTIIGGLAMLSLGIYSLLNGISDYRTTMTDVISWWTIALGAFFALYAGYSVIEENM